MQFYRDPKHPPRNMADEWITRIFTRNVAKYYMQKWANERPVLPLNPPAEDSAPRKN